MITRETTIAEFLEAVEVSMRTTNCLYQAEVGTVGQLLDMKEWELLRLPMFGRKSLNELKEVLASLGFRFAFQPVNLALSLSPECYARLTALAEGRPVGKFAADILEKAIGNQLTVAQRLERLEREVFGQG